MQNYPSDNGWVAGIKYNNPIETALRVRLISFLFDMVPELQMEVIMEILLLGQPMER
ncbi:hypothetical protein [Flavobacterium sp. ZB4R12]|uniref:hypothetical protein n=1 Tax=Flavobacterium sp. ZB4R12 TaxID=3398732 RepID=UPI003AAFFDBC